MKYADLKAAMVEFRAGTIEREDMVAAIALWQRPVEITKAAYDRAISKFEREDSRPNFYALEAADKRAKAAVEAVIR